MHWVSTVFPEPGENITIRDTAGVSGLHGVSLNVRYGVVMDGLLA